MKNNKIEQRIKRLEIIKVLYERLELFIEEEESNIQYHETRIQEKIIEESLCDEDIEESYYIQNRREDIEEHKFKIAEASKIKAELEKMA